MASSLSDVGSLFEIKSFEGIGFYLWRDKTENILFFKDSDGALVQVKTAHLSNVTWDNLNKKAIAYIKTLVDLKGLTKVYDAWKKLTATYQNIILMNQVHLMR